MVPKWLMTVIIICVLAVWVFSLIEGIIEDDYEALAITTPVMLTLAGFVFGTRTKVAK